MACWPAAALAPCRQWPQQRKYTNTATTYVCTCVQTGPVPSIHPSSPVHMDEQEKKRATLEAQRAACQVSGGAGLGSLRRESTHSFPTLLATRASSCLYLATITVRLPQRFSLCSSSFARRHPPGLRDSACPSPAAHSPPHTPHPRSTVIHS